MDRRYTSELTALMTDQKSLKQMKRSRSGLALTAVAVHLLFIHDAAIAAPPVAGPAITAPHSGAARLSYVPEGWTVSRHFRDTPQFAVAPLTYYRVSLRSMLSPDELGGVIFFDADGKEIAADNYLSLDSGTQWAENEFYFRAHPAAASALVRFLIPAAAKLKATAVRIEVAREQDVARWQQKIIAEMPTLRYVPDHARLDELPHARQRLRSGQPLRVVMLGDSIVNDTSNSLYEVLLRRHYPLARMEINTSIRGGTGSVYYKEENRVIEYVTRHRPDLLLIGGISHNYDADAIGEVIRQTRASFIPEQMPEILVMTGPIAIEEIMRRNFIASSGLSRVVAERRMDEFTPKLRAIAAREGAAFLDVRAIYQSYVANSGRPAAYFMRDTTHASTRGKLAVGQILEKYLSPCVNWQPELATSNR